MYQIQGYRLWLGHVGDLRDPSLLHNLRIEAVVDLALNEPPALLPREMIYCRIPLVVGAGNSPRRLWTAVETVATHLRHNIRTLIVCGAGLSRSPAIAAAAVAKFSGCDLSEALAQVTADQVADVSTALWAQLEEVLKAKR